MHIHCHFDHLLPVQRFRPVLPTRYYQHFCKLVFSVRFVLQRSIDLDALPAAYRRAVEYIEEFETLYYQRRTERLHFVRPCLHTLFHVFGEIERTSPCTAYSQWTLENFIGNLTREMKQHVTPYANLSERALCRCQINALKAMYPDKLDRAPKLPEGAKPLDCHPGYILLRPGEHGLHSTTLAEGAALHAYYRKVGVAVNPSHRPLICRWARLRLPNLQIARTLWKESIIEAR